MSGTDTKTLLQNAIILSVDGEIAADSVVIGSGAGGALTAAFLAEKGKEVLVIEEGPFARFEEGRAGIRETFPKVWREGGAIPIMSNASLLFGEGRCLGGSTMINAGLIHRVPEEVLALWRKEYGLENVMPKDFERYEVRIEQGLSAEIYDDSANPVSHIIRSGAAKKGFKGAQVPVARFEDSEGRMKKSSMQETYLKRAVVGGARILTNCRVEKIEISSGRAVALRARITTPEGSTIIRIRFSRLFVCAGTIQTPLLLRRSGIRKNIGNSVQFHPTLRIIAEFDSSLHASAYEMPSFQIKEFAPLLTMGASMTDTAFLASGLSSDWAAGKARMQYSDRMAIFYVGVKSKSLGRARNIPFGRGSYFVKYDLKREDMKNLGAGYAHLSSLLFAAGAKRLYPAINGVAPLTRVSEALGYLKEPLPLKKVNLVTIHSYGSCPAGENRRVTGLDSYGKLRDLSNVFVHDGSMLPTSPGVNPQGPLMAMVLRSLEKNFA